MMPQTLAPIGLPPSAPPAEAYQTSAPAPAQGGNIDLKGTILDRLQEHQDFEQKDVVYALRLVVANFLDITSPSSIRKPKRTDGRYSEVVKRNWEEGRSSLLTTSTHIQVKSQTYNDPDLHFDDVREEVSMVRVAYILDLWKRFGGAEIYRQKLLDMLIAGSGNVQYGLRGGAPFLEYADYLDIVWDSAYKEPHEKRFVFRDKHLPTSDVIKQYPAIASMIRQPGPDGRGGEKTVTITCYYSRTTTAVLYGKQFIEEPKPNPYPDLSIRETSLFKEPSVKYPTGIVEKGIGTHQIMLRLQRFFREVILRGTPVGVARGNFNEADIDRLEAGEEGVILRSPGSNSTFEWTQGAEIQASAIRLWELFQQLNNSESGVNDFMQGRTDTKVDFASQLSLMASQGGVQAKYTEQQFEAGLKGDFEMIMKMAAVIENPASHPVTLSIKGQRFVFDQMMPINPMLGDDGDIVLKPGGTAYKSAVQKLGEVAQFANVMALSQTMPAGTQERFIKMALQAFEIDNSDQWVDDWKAAELAAQQQQEAMAAAAAGQPMPGGQGGPQLPPGAPQGMPPSMAAQAGPQAA